MRFWVLLLASFSLVACRTATHKRSTALHLPFDSTAHPPAPDYSKTTSWAALPNRLDACDYSPNGLSATFNDTALADVFFIYPTSYTKEWISNMWNAPFDNEIINNKTKEGSLKYQASIFNKVGRIYAPYYRQAHIQVYFTPDKVSAQKAIDLAYEDVKAAFEYYLAHYNHGRPIIIASHSQGSTHGMRLVKEFFDNKPLQHKLVAAYLVGMAVNKKQYSSITASKSPEETGCICSWRSFEYGYTPTNYPLGNDIICTNPLTWNSDTSLVSKQNNSGAVLRNFDVIYPALADAQIHNGSLWIHKPKFKGSFLIRFKNYHIADYNFFYLNVMNNAHLRLMNYLKQ